MMHKGVVNFTDAQPIDFQHVVEVDCAMFVASVFALLRGLFNASLFIIDAARLEELDKVEAAVDGVE